MESNFYSVVARRESTIIAYRVVVGRTGIDRHVREEVIQGRFFFNFLSASPLPCNTLIRAALSDSDPLPPRRRPSSPQLPSPRAFEMHGHMPTSMRKGS